MKTGKVEGTSDATTIIGETCRVRHEGTTEKLKEVMEKLTETETQKIKETKEETVDTQRETQDYETKDEHTHT